MVWVKFPVYPPMKVDQNKKVVCCDDAKTSNSISWHNEQGGCSNEGFPEHKAGWTMIRDLIPAHRGMYWLMNVSYCPFCGSKLPE